MSESLWSIYNRAEEVRIDGLHAFQLRSMLQSFSHENFAHWLIWQEGWVDWQELSAVVDSLFPTIRQKTNTQVNAVPEMDPNSGVVAEQSPLTYASVPAASAAPTPPTPSAKNPEIPQPALSLVDTPIPDATAPMKQQERRANPRLPIPIKLFLHIDGGVIKNETSDVSLGGMRLKNPITKEAKGSFDVTMLHQGTELALKCKLLVNEGETPRTRLLIEKCNRIEILRSWIIEPKKESA